MREKKRGGEKWEMSVDTRWGINKLNATTTLKWRWHFEFFLLALPPCFLHKHEKELDIIQVRRWKRGRSDSSDSSSTFNELLIGLFMLDLRRGEWSTELKFKNVRVASERIDIVIIIIVIVERHHIPPSRSHVVCFKISLSCHKVASRRRLSPSHTHIFRPLRCREFIRFHFHHLSSGSHMPAAIVGDDHNSMSCARQLHAHLWASRVRFMTLDKISSS